MPIIALTDFNEPVLSVRSLRKQSVPVTEIKYLTIGGGLGSFAWVDLLLIAGVSPLQILVLGLEPKPYARFERLCKNSQIPAVERLRSNSDACPDNIWGWPSYGLRECWSALRSGRYRDALRVLCQLLGEPILTDTYTPRAGDVFRSLDREAARIGWSELWQPGRAKTIRKTDDGRYAVAYTPAGPGAPGVAYFIASYVHIAVGYPRFRVLGPVEQYRAQTQDYRRVVHAYEDHDHLYDHLRSVGGTVLVSGRGIVASRIIQRLYEVRAENPDVQVLHLMRSPHLHRTRFGLAWRKARQHCEMQPFNWPKAAFGGTMRQSLEKAAEPRRSALLRRWGGTTTIDRADWRQIASMGLREGWYEVVFGEITCVDCQDGTLAVSLRGGEFRQADFLIVCTGLEGVLENHALLSDLVEQYHLETKQGHLKVTGEFEIAGLRNGRGRCFACGVMTAGNAYAPVDSFLGLQYAAQRAVQSLVSQEPDVQRLTPLRSLVQWTCWVRGVRP